MQTVAIVGTGLIGASFGLAIRQAGFGGRILGVSSPAALHDALNCGAIDEAAALDVAIPQADLIYLAQPIRRILAVLPTLGSLVRAEALVTDVGSTKRAIVQAARACPYLFLGGHPMAGKETRGAAAGEAGLFHNRTYFLTPSEPTDLNRPAVQNFVHWVQAIGAQPAVTTAEEHDQTVAVTSHLPQMLSTALASLLSQQPDSARLAASAGPGLTDMTRLAMSSYEIWQDILDTNGDLIDAALARLESELGMQRQELQRDGLRDRFDAARRFAEQVRRRG